MGIAYSGVEGTVLIGAVDMNVTGYSVDVEFGTFDATTTGDAGWQSMKRAIKKVSGSFDFFHDTSKNPYVSPLDVDATTPTLTFGLGNSKTLTGPAIITKISKKSEVKDGIKYTASFESDGAWTFPT
jgi:hypothetical protein